MDIAAKMKTIAAEQAGDPGITTMWIGDTFNSTLAVYLGVDLARVDVAPTRDPEIAAQMMRAATGCREYQCIVVDLGPILIDSLATG